MRERAAALDDDTRNRLALGNERRGRRTEAVTEEDDALRIDPRMARNLVERLAIVADFRVVIERAAWRTFAVAGAGTLDTHEHRSGTVRDLTELVLPVGGEVE